MKNNSKNLLKNTLGANGFWMVNKHLARNIGYKAAILLAHLIDIRSYENMPDEFYQQMSRLQKELNFSKHDILKSIEVLKQADLVTVTQKGMPLKNYYSLNDDNIVKLMSESEEAWLKNDTASGKKIIPPAVKKLDRWQFKNLTANTNNLETNNQLTDKKTDQTPCPLDTLEASRTTRDESLAKAIVPPPTAKAVVITSIDDLDLSSEEFVNSEPAQEAAQELSLESVFIEEKTVQDVERSASSREHLKTHAQDTQQPVSGHAKTINIEGVPYLDVDISYRTLENGTLNQSLKYSNFKIPAHQLNNLNTDNAARLIDSWKHEHRPLYLSKSSILIDKVKIKYLNSETGESTHKWY